MDHITTKTPTPKCRLHWCSVEFIDWRYCTVSNVGIFDPALWAVAPQTFSLGPALPPPLPCVNKYTYCIWPVKRLCVKCLSEFIDWRYGQSCWHFWPSLWTVAPLIFSLVISLSPPCVLHSRIQWYWVMGLRQMKTWRKASLQVNYLDDDILDWLLWVLSFYAPRDQTNSFRFFWKISIKLYVEKSCDNKHNFAEIL